MALVLDKQQLPTLIKSMQRYVEEEMDIEIGELKSRLLLDYIYKEIAPIAYNQGVKDAESFMRERLEDLPGSCFEHEMTYWSR